MEPCGRSLAGEWHVKYVHNLFQQKASSASLCDLCVFAVKIRLQLRITGSSVRWSVKPERPSPGKGRKCAPRKNESADNQGVKSADAFVSFMIMSGERDWGQSR